MRVRCKGLFDSVAAELLDGAVLVIDDGMVTAIERDQGESSDSDADFGDAYIIPGLVDAHDHFGIDMGDGEEAADQDPQYRTLKGVKNARLMVESGITTLRSAGERHGLGNHMRRAIAKGWCIGPRSILSGVPICSTGGHGWFLGIEADGPDAVRAAVRGNVKNGCDMIKMIITGGVTTPGGTLVRTCFTQPEIEAAVSETHLAEKRIGVHCYGGPAATWAIEAGVDNIEHGTFLDNDQLEAMASRGTLLVATTSVMKAAADDISVAPFMRDRFREVSVEYVALLKRAKAAGVRIAVGCDTHHASLAEEVETLLEAGFTTAEALQAATLTGAYAAGVGGQVGSLSVGKHADFVVVDIDPIEDLPKALRSIRAVYKDGILQAGGGSLER